MYKPPSYVIELRKIVLDETGLHDAEKVSFEIGEQKYNECIGCASHSSHQSGRDKALDILRDKYPVQYQQIVSFAEYLVSELRQQGGE